MPTLAHMLEVAAFILAAYLSGCALGYAARALAHRWHQRPRFESVPNGQAATSAPPARQPTPAQRLARTVRAETDPVAAPQQQPAATPDHGRPPALAAARGAPDDLRRIKGIGPRTAEQLEALGVYHFWQIAAWSPAEIAWLEDRRVAIKGRIAREQWVEQAALLATALTSSAA